MQSNLEPVNQAILENGSNTRDDTNEPVQMMLVDSVSVKKDVIQWESCSAKISPSVVILANEYKIPMPDTGIGLRLQQEVDH